MTATPTDATASSPLSRRFWAWMACNLVTCVVYLLPVPGERFLLLLGLATFWAGVIAGFWQHRWLRLLPMAVAMLCFFPVRTGTLRLLLLGGLIAVWISAMVLARQRRPVLGALLAVGAIAAGFLLLPGRTPNPDTLRAEYVRSMQAFQGTTYIWGGENGLGIDCSGLIRCGWIDANLRTGVRTLNPGLVRQAAWTWLHDCSAKELGEGYRNRTQLLGIPASLNQLDYTQVQPGIIAVPESGIHILAYVGDRRWIAAEADKGTVLIRQVPVEKSIWFDHPMKILRWRIEQ